MLKVTAYQCSYCKDRDRRLYLSKSGCRQHEKRCWLNPARKSCATCDNLEEGWDNDTGSYWLCSRRMVKRPFKQKVVNCLAWTEAVGIFNDEEMRFSRPVDRLRGAGDPVE